MHEMSLVQALLTQLRELAAAHGKGKIITVQVEIGPFSGVVVDSFQFGFEVLAKESELTRECALHINAPAAVYQCCECGEKAAGQRPESCHHCSGTLYSPAGSTDIILQRVEME